MKDNPQVTYLTTKEIKKILKYVEKNADNKFKNRDLCILKLGFATGLRVSAIVQIDIDDIDFANNQIKVTEKGNRHEYILFGEQVKEQLLLWLDDREKYFPNCKTNALFVSLKNNRLSVDRLRDMLHNYTKNVTDKNVTPHVMRHSCATNLYEKTGDIYLCASQLHHKNVSTTQRYAEISKSRKTEAANILDKLI
jgi:site-specific recombinase XerD